MPLVKGSSEGAFKQNVRTLMGEVGKSPHVQSRAQALAIAYSKKRSGRAEGGLVGYQSGGRTYSNPYEVVVPEDRAVLARNERAARAGERAQPFSDENLANSIARGYNALNRLLGRPLNPGAASVQSYGDMQRAQEVSNAVPRGQPIGEAREYSRGPFSSLTAYPQGGLVQREQDTPDDAHLIPVLDPTPPPKERAAPPIVPWQDPSSQRVYDILRGRVPQPPLLTPPADYGRRLARGGLGAPQLSSMGHMAAFNAGQVARGLIPVRRRASGGGLGAIDAPPGVHLINAATPGRTDRIPMRARPGSYILPADVVSGLGQGNTLAGAKLWGQILSRFKQQPLASPAATGVMTTPTGFARGGADDDKTDIITAGGEMVIDAPYVAAIGLGDPERGKEILHQAVLNVRAQMKKEKLPEPVA